MNIRIERWNEDGEEEKKNMRNANRIEINE